MGCAGSHAGVPTALAEDLPTCENPLVASCVADEELTVVLQRYTSNKHMHDDAGNNTMTQAKHMAVMGADGTTLCSMVARPSVGPTGRDGVALQTMRRTSAVCASDGTVVGAVKTEQTDLPRYKDPRSMIYYSTTPLFEGQESVAITLEGTEIPYAMYPRLKQVSPPYSLLLESIYLATPSGFEENYSYKFMGFARELNWGPGGTAAPEGGPTGRFFIMDPRNQKVALARAAGDGAYNLKVAKGMDASLVAVVYLMSELLKDETGFRMKPKGDRGV